MGSGFHLFHYLGYLERQQDSVAMTLVGVLPVSLWGHRVLYVVPSVHLDGA